MKLTFQWLRANFTGISTPLVGLSWQANISEKEVVRKLFVYLEDKRSLYAARYASAHMGRPEHLTQSVIEIRKQVTATMQEVSFPEEVKKVLESMRAACREFLDDTPRVMHSATGSHTRASHTNLLPWQKVMAAAIASLAITYELDLDENLSQLVSTVL